jgi:hypothetical protein
MTGIWKKMVRALPCTLAVAFVAAYATGCCCPCCWGAPTTPDPGTGGEFAVQPAAATAGPVGHATGMAF